MTMVELSYRIRLYMPCTQLLIASPPAAKLVCMVG